MALPALQIFENCADWNRTVEPYLPQLYALPAKLLDVVQSRQGLVELYTQTNPLISGFAFSVFLGFIFLVVSEINQNFSQVDRCWSILPAFYVAHFDLWARLSGLDSSRIDSILLFSTAWSVRLTYNYWRKGGYNVGSEDYRWEIIQAHIPTWAFKLLNLTFISFMQSVILFGLAAPVYPILLSTQFQSEAGAPDLAFAAFELVLIAIEWVADQQQWVYQTAKYEYRGTGKLPKGFRAADLDRGFCTSGLWAYSRHPNFAMEQTIWVALYAWSAYQTNTPFFWAAAGPAALLGIFVGSTILTEVITAGKYPEYKEYQRQVGKFVPLGLAGYQPLAANAAGGSSPADGNNKKKKQI